MENKESGAKCVFDIRDCGIGCKALTKKICNHGKCGFYKSSDEYELDEDGYAVKREESDK